MIDYATLLIRREDDHGRFKRYETPAATLLVYCKSCGAVVVNEELHAEYHLKLEATNGNNT